MEPSFELFDHTADIGFRVRAAAREGLLEPAARALYTVIGDLAPAAATAPLAIELTGWEAPYLLRDFLAELLVLFERDGRIAVSFDAPELRDDRLAVRLATAPLDTERSVLLREVKAITYHELDIHSIPGGYEAVVIMDI